MPWAGGPDVRVLVVMDPVATVDEATDTSFALMLAAQRAGHDVFHAAASDVFVGEGRCQAIGRPATMAEGTGRCIDLGAPAALDLTYDVDAVLVRTDPPFDVGYLRLTWLLDGLRGTTPVLNDPRGLRQANEHLYALRFPDLIPETLVSADRTLLLRFADEHGAVVLKPVDGHAGRGVHTLVAGDRNARAIVDTLTVRGSTHVVAQRFLDGVYAGDKRILLLDGRPLGAINRVPSGGDFRANLGLGGHVEAVPLDDRDHRIVEVLAPSLREDGLWFVGIDVIDGYLSEVNVTSPTGIRQLSSLTGRRVEDDVVVALEALVATARV